MQLKQKRKAYSLVEIVVVITIVSILTSAGIAIGSKQIAKSRIEETTAFVQVLDNGLEDGIINNTGFLDLSEYDFSEPELAEDAERNAEAFLRELEDLYLNCTFDYSSMEKIYNGECGGFRIRLADPVDSWGMPYVLFYMYDQSSDRYIIVIGSAGPNNVFADGYNTGYMGFIKSSATKSTQVDDDIIDIMISR